jgi:hypothetical protein
VLKGLVVNEPGAQALVATAMQAIAARPAKPARKYKK